jgi:hypothetical protein
VENSKILDLDNPVDSWYVTASEPAMKILIVDDIAERHDAFRTKILAQHPEALIRHAFTPTEAIASLREAASSDFRIINNPDGTRRIEDIVAEPFDHVFLDHDCDIPGGPTFVPVASFIADMKHDRPTVTIHSTTTTNGVDVMVALLLREGVRVRIEPFDGSILFPLDNPYRYEYNWMRAE